MFIATKGTFKFLKFTDDTSSLMVGQLRAINSL